MKRRNYLLLALLLPVAIGGFVVVRKQDKHDVDERRQEAATTNKRDTQLAASPIGNSSIPPFDEKRNKAVRLIQSVYSTPIEFFGRVEDQYGVAVPGASIDYSIIDKYFDSPSKRSDVSDDKGHFSLTGIRGAALTVGVSKIGYAPIYGRSNGTFPFGVPFDAQRDRPVPTHDEPAAFVLRKKSEADPVFVVNRDVKIPKNGAPIEISLRTGKPVPPGQGDIRVECWTADQTKGAQSRYDWHARLSVPGGGIRERTQPELIFTAPETGYTGDTEIRMTPDSPQWKRDHDANYWVKLRDGTYARMRFRITTSGDHFASIESYLNPSGSANLEFDEGRVIK